MKDAAGKPDISHPIIVGIGASAGGLEAFQQFLKGLPPDHTLIIVLIQHLDPDHNSLMPELVAAKTSSPVHSVRDHMQIEPGHIYLIPPGFEMEIVDDRLLLKEFESPRGMRRPIDQFFKSLAKAHGENAIAVVLSGTGSDGAEGAREIKGAGGLVFVQDPKQAKYDGMPQSVLDQCGADVISKAEEIVDVVRDYFSIRVGIEPELVDDEAFILRIMRHVRFRTGHDFSDYKPGTMLRRIAVRMSVLNLSAPSDYLKYIAEQKHEADLLFQDLLINVTSFFRNQEHFDEVATKIIPKIVEDTEEHGEIRVWVVGCSTGEEAYSIGILLLEEVKRVNKQCKIIVFGTDIDEGALSIARLGRYSDAIIDAVPAHFLETYFRAANDGYEVGPDLRETVRFSRHSFIKDPPFSKLDLVMCRNVLIYLNDVLQELAVKVFHYALRESGHLFIGPSENPRSISSYFTDVSQRARIFARRPGLPRPLDLGTLSSARVQHIQPSEKGQPSDSPPTDLERILLEDHVPAYIHIDHEGRVIFTSPSATRFLRVRSGQMSTDLTSIIAIELETAARRVVRLDALAGSTSEREFQGEIAGHEERLLLIARRLADGGVLLVIHDNLILREGRPGSVDVSDQSDEYIKQLEIELDSARQSIRTTVEELETSNEELKSSNEEMMSMNEELQSANEELTTINDELQEKLRELNQANLDLSNFIKSARTPIVFLDDSFHVRSFTPEAEEYFSFVDSDVGRHINDLTATIDLEALLELCTLTSEDQYEREREFTTRDGKTSLLVRIMPYSHDGRNTHGVVFTLQDVTELREAVDIANTAQKISEQRLNEVEQIYQNSPLAMCLIGRDMTYKRLNEQLATINGFPMEKHLGATVREIIPAVADQTEELVTQVIDNGEPVRGMRVTGSTRSEPDRTRVWESDWVPFKSDGEIVGVSVTVRDITEQLETANSLRRVMSELEHRVKNMLANVVALVNQAQREVEHDSDVYTKLTNRIEGLAKTHALLTSERWSSAPLLDIIAPETADLYGEERVHLKGPDIRVNSQTTLVLGMAIHELATNAAKYGAFSVPDGTVTVTWSRVNDAESDRLLITWVERGGPPTTSPTSHGFGTQLISSTLEGSLGGHVSMDWQKEGLICKIELGFDIVSEIDPVNELETLSETDDA